MKKLLTFLMASILAIGVGWASDVTDELTLSLTGISGGSGYGNWSGKTSNSSAVYAGNSAGGQSAANPSIQLRSNNDNSGIITTASGGVAKKIVITFNSYSTSTRTINVYGKSSAYASASDLYDAGEYGTLIGTIVGSASNNNKELTISGDYEYIGLRSNSNAIYIDKIEITWETEGGGTPTVAKPTFSPEGGTYFEAQYVTLSCATEGADIFWGYDGVNFATYDGDAILVNSTMTLYAYAMKGGMSDSDLASATYTIKSIPTVSLPYGENFSGDFGDFYVVNEVYPGFAVWKSASYNNKPFAKASGYNGGAKESESWLISPYINLTDATVPQLSFSQAIDNHFVTIADEATLWVKEKSASDWTQINITYPEAPDNGYTDFEAQTIDLTAYKDKIIQIAFKYTSSASNSGTWEVADFKVQEKPLDKAYYLTGSFNNWGNDSDNPQFTKLDDNTFVLRNQEVAANMMFKIRDEYDSWLGGGEQTYNINKDSFRNLPLNKDQAANFCIQTAGTYDFVIKIDDQGVATLFVPQTTDLYLKGSFDGWNEGDKFARNEDGSYTLTEKVLEEASAFKIYDVSDAWYSGNITNITENETTITLQDGNNISIPAGKWTFNIDIAKATMVVSRVVTPHRITIDSNIENGTVTADKQTAVVGEKVTLTVNPGNGYELGTLTVMNGETPVEVAEDNTFIMPDADVVVSATFTKIQIPEGDYVKVTSADDLTSGIYLIVYEEGSLAFDGGLETLDAVGNSIPVDIRGNMIKSNATVDAATFTYNATAKTLKSASGHYIGRTAASNGFNESETEAYQNTITIEDGHAVITSSGGPSLQYLLLGQNSRFRYYSSSQRAVQLYKKTNEHAPSLATPVIEGETPFFPTTTVTITCADEDAKIYYTLDGTDPTASGTEFTAPFTLDAEATVKAIAINGNEFSVIASKEFKMKPTVATIAEYKELESGTEFGFTGNVTVTYVNSRYLYVKDETGSALIYGDTGTEFEFTQGQVLAPNWTAKTKNYNGLLEAETPANLVATNETVEVVPAEMQVNAISTDNENEYIIVKNVAIGEPDNKNFTITDADENTITGRTNFTNVTHPTDFTVNYDITCVVAEFNGTVQLYPTDYKVHVESVLLEGVVFAEGRNWATWYGDQDLALPAGVTAYIVTDISGENATVEALDYIPAETGVLLNCSAAKESVEAMPCEPETPATVTGNLLVGVAEPKAVSDAYVLYNNAFILIQNGTEVAAHRCYLPVENPANAAPVLRLSAPGTVTGVDDLVIDGNGSVKYYDLSGRYVGTSLSGKRGIFVTSDGKKVVK